jgi:hypothetical protein
MLLSVGAVVTFLVQRGAANTMEYFSEGLAMCMVMFTVSLASALVTSVPRVVRGGECPEVVEMIMMCLLLISLWCPILASPWYHAGLWGYERETILDRAEQTDTTVLLAMDMAVTSVHLLLPIRSRTLLLFQINAVLSYAVPAVVLGSPEARNVPFNTSVLAVLVVMAGVGKRSMEFRDRMAHIQILKEKELRVRSEFELSRVHSSFNHPPPVRSEKGDSKLTSETKETRSLHSRVTSSLQSCRSAPANLIPSAAALFLRDTETRLINAPGCEGEEACEMDCFPTSATVWAEGRTSPTQVKDVVAGQRILCYDLLTRGMRYVEVSFKHMDSKAIEWVEVTLDDGTKLEMTSEHPVRAMLELKRGADKSAMSGKVCRACDLQPGKDSIMVHRAWTQPAKVKSVEFASAEDRCMYERVSLSVHQPNRYSLMVSKTGTPELRAMAVGSADLNLPSTSPIVKNTFLHYRQLTDEHEDGTRIRRAVSEPPAHRRHGVVSQKKSRQPSKDFSSRNDGSSNGCRRTHSESDMQSMAQSTLSSRGSKLSNECPSVIVLPSMDIHQPTSGGSYAVTKVMEASAKKWPSLGCDGHSQGSCNPCHRYQRGSCKRGISCAFCHMEHTQRKIRGKKVLFPKEPTMPEGE